MPFARPSFTSLLNQTLTYLSGALGYQPVYGSEEYILGQVTAAVADANNGYIDYIYQQSTPWGATDVQLAAWGALRGLTKIPAQFASGTVSFTGTSGSVINANTLLVAANNQQYSTNAEFIIGTTSSVTATAIVAGSVGNLPSGAVMSLVSTVAGVNPTTVSSTAFTGGTDIETDDAFKTRVLQKWATEQSGGNTSDYIGWCLDAGATRAWCLGQYLAAGSVTLFPMFDGNANAGFPIGTNGVATSCPFGTPATGNQLTIANYIFPLAPVSCLVYVQAPVPQNITVAISGLGLSNSYNSTTGWSSTPTTLETNILSNLQAMLVLDGTPLGGTISVSQIYGAISATSGVGAFTLTSPTTAITTAVASLPVIGNLTFSP